MRPVRTDAVERVLALARRLAEEFDSVPLPLVSRAVRTAADAVQTFGEDVTRALPTIERIARANLAALRDAGVYRTGAVGDEAATC